MFVNQYCGSDSDVGVAFAVGVACVPLVGMAMGAGQVARARRIAWTGSLLGMLVAVAPQLWTGLFTDNPAVLNAAHSYLRWVGPTFGLFGLGLCLYFASQGSGKILGPVLAQSVRLIVVAAGGWWLTTHGGTTAEFFMLVGAALTAYGIASFFAVWLVSWEPAMPAPARKGA